MERTFSPFIPPGVEEMNRQNMAMFERAVSLWNPFARTGEAANDANGQPGADAKFDGSTEEGSATSEQPAENAEMNWLRGEVESLRRQLAAAHAAAVLPAPTVVASVIPENVRRDRSLWVPTANRRVGRDRKSQLSSTGAARAEVAGCGRG